MSTIYGLREVGSIEIRYIGFSNHPLELRLKKHLGDSRSYYYYRPVTAWVRSAGQIEIVPLCTCDPSEARANERRMVQAFHAAGHRLTNGHLLPRSAVEAISASQLNPDIALARAA